MANSTNLLSSRLRILSFAFILLSVLVGAMGYSFFTKTQTNPPNQLKDQVFHLEPVTKIVRFDDTVLSSRTEDTASSSAQTDNLRLEPVGLSIIQDRFATITQP